MGEVWRAKDVRLEREVAIKVLPEDLFGDGDRIQRFEREAKALAALNHPGIAAVHSFEEIGGRHLLVQELLEGETLREAMAAGKLPLRKTLDYAAQIAKALAAAHEKGVVHRDLKPENLFVTRDGRVKILDFGLAKLTQMESPNAATNMPTVSKGTEPGVVLGTLGYMSPEQVRGKPADARSDIFSFGAVLYEMVAGRKAFAGDSAADTMSAILKEDPPDLSVTNASIPAGLERIVRHCLEKNPEQRFHSAHDIAFDLESITSGAASGARAVSSQGSALAQRRVALPVAAAAGVVALAAGLLAGRSLIGRTPAPPTFKRLTFRRGLVQSARFAPDGETVVYAGAWEGGPFEVFRTRSNGRESRSFGLAAADVLSISKGGDLALSLGRRYTFGWESTGTLAQVPLDGTAPREILENVQEADWAPDGKSLAVVRAVAGRYRLELPVGKVLYETSGWISNPRISRQGDRIAFVDHPLRGDNIGTVCVVDLAGKKTTWTSVGATALAWSPDGRELWGSWGASVWALSGPGEPKVFARFPGGVWLLDVSAGGRALIAQLNVRREIVGLAPGETVERNLSWFDWSVPDDLSSDGRTVLFDEANRGLKDGYEVYLRRTDGAPAIQIGEGSGLAISPDGKWVLAVLHPFDKRQLALMPTGAGEQKALPEDGVHYEGWGAFLPGARRIVVAGSEERHLLRLYVRDLEGGRGKPFTPEGLKLGINSWVAVSPDGTFVAASNGEGKVLLYPVDGGEARPLPGLEPGEELIRWSSDPNVVFVCRADEMPLKIFRLDVRTGAREPWRQVAPVDPAGVFSPDFIRLSANGRAYVYTFRRLLSDLYVVDGLR
jgi:eukaryotic-like serine/threonine-protein kinase